MERKSVEEGVQIFDDYLEHSWGTSPEQKKKEREYNHEYWLNNRDRILYNRSISTRQYINNIYDASSAGMEQATNKANAARTEEDRKAANLQYIENLQWNNKSIAMRNAMNLYSKKPVNDFEKYVTDTAYKLKVAFNKVKNKGLNIFNKILYWPGGKRDAGSNMPTNQSDLDTITREQNRDRTTTSRTTSTTSTSTTSSAVKKKKDAIQTAR